jgi:hypothetical protein
MKRLILFLSVVISTGCQINRNIKTQVAQEDTTITNQIIALTIYKIEQAYYEGQVDALKGDIRVERVVNGFCNDTVYRWIRSPWNSGETPTFEPPICNPR